MSLTKRDIELIQLGFKCFENPPKVRLLQLTSDSPLSVSSLNNGLTSLTSTYLT